MFIGLSGPSTAVPWTNVSTPKLTFGCLIIYAIISLSWPSYMHGGEYEGNISRTASRIKKGTKKIIELLNQLRNKECTHFIQPVFHLFFKAILHWWKCSLIFWSLSILYLTHEKWKGKFQTLTFKHFFYLYFDVSKEACFLVSSTNSRVSWKGWRLNTRDIIAS